MFRISSVSSVSLLKSLQQLKPPSAAFISYWVLSVLKCNPGLILAWSQRDMTARVSVIWSWYCTRACGELCAALLLRSVSCAKNISSRNDNETQLELQRITQSSSQIPQITLWVIACVGVPPYLILTLKVLKLCHCMLHVLKFRHGFQQVLCVLC